MKKGVLENFVKFTGNHLRQSHSIDNVAGLRHATILKKRIWLMCFLVSFAKFPCFENTSERLLLKVIKFVLNKLAS